MMSRLSIILAVILACTDGMKSVDESINFGEICPNIMRTVFENSAPIGKTNAGNFTEHTKGDPDLKACVEDCCLLKGNCNVAFLYGETCYHVKCITNELCLPKEMSSDRIEGDRNTQMVLVNPVNDGTSDDLSWRDLLKNANQPDFLAADTEKPSLKDYWSNTRKFQLAQALENSLPFISGEGQLPTKRIGSVYMQRKGYDSFANEPQYAADENDMLAEESAYVPEIKPVACEFGADTNCRANELCVPIRVKSRNGICECKPTFRRNELGECISSDFSDSKLVEKILEGARDASGEINFSENTIKTSTTKGPLEQLTVSVKNKTVRFPEKEVSLAVYTVPDEQTTGNVYKYQWTLITQPTGAVNGTISDQTKDTIRLSNLSEGLYVFKVTVSGNRSYGETMANVTVSPERRINKPPIAIITPKEQTVKLPSSQAILDGSTSTDDDKIINWHWELIQGPIGYQKKLPETGTLQLSDLNLPGNYTFKLTVTDSDNIQNSTTANITVLKEKDYPPQANAGTDVIIYLPHNNVTLNGSLSTDDRGIVAWEWTKDANDQGKAVDMQNTRTPYLELSNLEEGIYTFVLKVTDASNQSNTANVRVFVKPPSNMPPVANAGTNMTINLPQSWVTLSGSKSTDDIRVTNYYWRQKIGPNNAVIANANASIANATSLTLGLYTFELTVSDENQNSASDLVWIKVIQEKNSPPIANAGGDQTITLPITAIYLNGSKSSDDLGIVNYTWTRDGASLAIGNIVGTTSNESVLILTDVVPGRYVFRLTVTDDQGLTGTDTVSIIVHSDPLVLNLVELTLSMGISVLSQSELDSLVQKIVLLIGDVKVNVRELRMEPKSGDAILVFYVEKVGPDGKKVISGLEIERILKDKFWRDATILGTSFNDVRTTICQNKCSDHGICNYVTRACICETFWMPSIFYFWGIDEANCDWSILYVAVGIFVGFLLLSGIFWGITCLCRRSQKPRTRAKVQKYALLDTQEEDIPAFARNTSLTDSETDSDVVFESRTKPIKGILRSNGVAKNGPKYSTTRLGRRIKT